MFTTLSGEIAARLLSIRQFVALTDSLEANSPGESATCKGLVFVQMYAVYEFTIRGSVQSVLASVKGDGTPPIDLCDEFLTLVLDAELTAAAKAGRPRLWEKRLALLASMSSSNPLSISDTLFPSDGSHYRPQQLRTIWSVLGINNPIVPDLRHLGRIEELVENRNSIAHGRNTADSVGRRYSGGDIKHRLKDVELITSHIVATVQAHYESGALRI